jgi:hypothetical protein
MKDDGGSVLISVASPQQVGLASFSPLDQPHQIRNLNFK